MMQERIKEIDYLRGVSALAVVLIHVSAVYLRPVQENAALFILVSTLNSFSKFAVQLFIFISGFLLFYKYSGSYNVRALYVKRFKHILIPYAFWMGVYVLMSGKFLTMPIGHFFWYYLRSLLSSEAAPHMYFILLILQFYLLFPLVKRYLEKIHFSKNFLWWAALLYLILLVFDYYIIGLGIVHLPKFLMTYKNRVFISWYIYFLYGAYAAHYFTDIKETFYKYGKITAAFMLTMLLIVVTDFYISVKHFSFDMGFAATPLKPSIYIYTLFSIPALYVLSRKIKERHGRLDWALCQVSRHSLILYFAHPITLKYVFRLKLAPWPVLNLMVTYFVTVAVTMLLSVIVSKNEKTAALVGTE